MEHLGRLMEPNKLVNSSLGVCRVLFTIKQISTQNFKFFKFGKKKKLDIRNYATSIRAFLM